MLYKPVIHHPLVQGKVLVVRREVQNMSAQDIYMVEMKNAFLIFFSKFVNYDYNQIYYMMYKKQYENIYWFCGSRSHHSSHGHEGTFTSLDIIQIIWRLHAKNNNHNNNINQLYNSILTAYENNERTCNVNRRRRQHIFFFLENASLFQLH